MVVLATTATAVVAPLVTAGTAWAAPTSSVSARGRTAIMGDMFTLPAVTVSTPVRAAASPSSVVFGVVRPVTTTEGAGPVTTTTGLATTTTGAEPEVAGEPAVTTTVPAQPSSGPAVSPSTSAVSGDPGSSMPGWMVPIFSCIRFHESTDEYGINTGNGYFGAYQMLPGTWDTAVAGAGFGTWDGQVWADGRADLAPPWMQDRAAVWLALHVGWGQWSTAPLCGE